MSKAKTEKEQLETNKLLPDTGRFTDRVLALAEEQPADGASRDAAIWIVEQSTHHSEVGAWGGKVSRAMDILLEHHADDPRVGRLCLSINGRVSPNRDRFLEGLLARTRNREVRGLVTLSLGEYLAVATDAIESLKTRESIAMKFVGGGGRLDLDPQDAEASIREGAAYFKLLMKRDSAALRTGRLNCSRKSRQRMRAFRTRAASVAIRRPTTRQSRPRLPTRPARGCESFASCGKGCSRPPSEGLI